MKTIISYVTRSNAWRSITFIAFVSLYLLITSWMYAAFVGVCCLIILITVFTEKINGIYYFLHTYKYRIAFFPPKAWIGPPYNYELRKWFFSYLTKHHPHLNIKIKQLYILGFGFGIKINKELK